MRRLISACLVFLFISVSAHAAFLQAAVNGASAPPTNPTFVLPTGSVLHYINPAGNDLCLGTSPSLGSSGACAWLTPNHPMNCGEVILAAAGTYSQTNFGASWGTVSTCPSTSGGIDTIGGVPSTGSGGVWFASVLCSGTDVEACPVVDTRTSNLGAFNLGVNNWAMEGFKVHGLNDRGFMANSPNSTTIIHHLAFINDISYGNLQGFGMNDCPGGSCNQNVPGNGVDYWAVVGSITQNAALDSICLASIDAVGVAVSDTNAGTHIFVNGNYVIANNTTSNGCTIDQDGIMLDTWDAHGYTQQGVVSNNIAFSSTRYGLQIFTQRYNSGTTNPTIKAYGNSFYTDLLATGTDSADGEINMSCAASGGSCSSNSWPVTIQNNIAYNANATSPSGGNPVYAAVLGGLTWSGLTFGGSGNQNVLKGSASTCAGTCDGGNNVSNFASNSLGTQTYVNPAYTNLSDLITNQRGVPNCTGFENTAQCMGYNATTTTLTTPSVISDLVPTAGGTSGKGYQLPSITCAANADYPTWLKGIVYLHWNGTTITENAGLVTKPCGL